MKKRRWTARAAARYAILQIPALLLLLLVLILADRWVDLPGWVIGVPAGLWLLKDIALFPFVWRAYDKEEATRCMIGARGLAISPLSPSGHVRVQGELWRAEVLGKGPPIAKGRRVVVRDVAGLRLVVDVCEESGS